MRFLLVLTGATLTLLGQAEDHEFDGGSRVSGAEVPAAEIEKMARP